MIAFYILVFAGWEPLESNEVNPSLSVDYSVKVIENNCEDIDFVRLKVIKSTSVDSDHIQTKFIDNNKYFFRPHS